MALILLEGFDGAASSNGDTGAADVVKYMEARYSGVYTAGADCRVYDGWGGNGKAYSHGRDGFAGSNYFYLDLGTTIQTTFLAFACKPSISIANYNMTYWRNVADGRVHVRSVMLQGRHLQFHRTGGTALLGTAYNIFRPDRWTYVEIKVTIDDTTGAIEVKANNVQVLNLTNIDTRDLGTTATIDTIQFSGITGTADNSKENFLLDDMYITDTSGSNNTSFLGPIKVEELLPDGAGDTTNFTPSAGSNYQNVDETPRDDDTTYNSDSTSTNKDLFTASNLSLIDSTVFGVQVTPECRVTDATTYGVKPKCKHSTSEGTGTSQTVSDTANYSGFPHVFELNPSTSTAWTVTTVNAMQIGYEVT